MLGVDLSTSNGNYNKKNINQINLSGFEMDILQKYGYNLNDETKGLIANEKLFQWVKCLFYDSSLLKDKIPTKVIILKKIIEYDYENFPEFSFGLLEIEIMKKIFQEKEVKEKRFYILGYRKIKVIKSNPNKILNEIEIYYLSFYQTPINFLTFEFNSEESFSKANEVNKLFDSISDYLQNLIGNSFTHGNCKYGCFFLKINEGKNLLSCELEYVCEEIKSIFYLNLKDLYGIISKPEIDKKELSWMTVCFGILYRSISDLDNAMLEFSKALSLRNLLYGENHQDVADAIEKIGVVKMEWRKYDEAVILFKQVHEIRVNCLSKYDFRIADSLYNIGVAYLRLNNIIVSKEYFDKSLDLLEKIKEQSSNSIVSFIELKIANSLQGLAFTYLSKGEWKEMLGYLLKSLAIHINYFEFDHGKIGILTEKIAFIYKNIKQEVRAFEYGLRTYQIYLKFYGKDNRTQKSLKFLKELRNFKEIKRVFFILINIRSTLAKTYKRRLILEEILLQFI